MNLQERQQVEINYWKISETERPEVDSIDVLLDKMGDASILLDCIRKYDQFFRKAESILELGAGQGWASCLVKDLYPDAKITTTDISPWALKSIHKWERIFSVKIDSTASCTSYEIPKADSSVDVIFCFAAAHHFVAHRKTLKEIERILKPGGKCFYFYEPSCPRYLYKLSYWRANRIRPDVPEDVLRYREIQQLAHESNLVCELHFYPTFAKRRTIETLYYMFLSTFPVFQWFLPSGINYCFTKPDFKSN